MNKTTLAIVGALGLAASGVAVFSGGDAKADPPDVVQSTIDRMERDQLTDVEPPARERSAPEITAEKVRCVVSDVRRMRSTHKSLLDIAHDCGVSMAQVKRIDRVRKQKITEAREVENPREEPEPVER